MPFSAACSVIFHTFLGSLWLLWEKIIHGRVIVPVTNMVLLLLCRHRLQDWAVLHSGQQPDVPGPAQRNHLHQDSVLRNHWSGVGSPLWAVPRPATPLQERIHPQHSHWSVPRSDWTNTQWCFSNDHFIIRLTNQKCRTLKYTVTNLFKLPWHTMLVVVYLLHLVLFNQRETFNLIFYKLHFTSIYLDYIWNIWPLIHLFSHQYVTGAMQGTVSSIGSNLGLSILPKDTKTG